MSAIKGVKGTPNGSCILTLRDRPSTERGDAPRAHRSPRPAVAHPSPLARRTGRTRPAVPLCSLASCRTRTEAAAKPRTGWKETSPAAHGGPFPYNSRCQTGSSAPSPKSLVPTPPNFTAPQPQLRRGSGFRGSPCFPEHPLAPTATQGRQAIQSARERPRRRDPLTETWLGFKA